MLPVLGRTSRRWGHMQANMLLAMLYKEPAVRQLPNILYIVGSLCFLAGTILNMVRTR